MYYSDLHIHSRYSRATSKNLTFPYLVYWGALKGLHVIGTGDILHPGWNKEFHQFLRYDDNTGFYTFDKSEMETIDTFKDPIFQKRYTHPIYFIPTVETSHIYKDLDKVRRVHLVTVFKNIEDAEKIQEFLSNEGYNLTSDGRPTMGLSVYDYLSILLNTLGEEAFTLIPAHIWTPWYALLGSKSGYDSIKDAFRDLTKYITALETGLSSDPRMNRYVPEIDDYILVSHSDAHSPQKLAREANVHNTLTNVDILFESLKKGTNLLGTIEFFPEEGRYHYDGHRKCGIQLHPKESIQYNNTCPKCQKPLTLGVLHRVLKLANNRIEPNERLLNKFQTFYAVPLITIIAQLLNKPETSKFVFSKYLETIKALGSELDILLNIDIKVLQQYDAQLACLIYNMRNGKLKISPGYDGVYGIVKIDDEENCFDTKHQLRLL